MKIIKKINKKNGGFIQITVIIVGILVILKYAYDIDVIGFLTQGEFKEFLDKLYNFGAKGWEKYSGAIIGVWHYVVEFVRNLAVKVELR